MCIKAVRIDEGEQDETFSVLNAILSNRRERVEVSPMQLALRLNISEGSVRYQIKKLVKLGYLRALEKGYEPTGKVLFLIEK